MEQHDKTPPQKTLFELAQQLAPVGAEDTELYDAWQVVLHGIEHMPFGEDDLRDLLSDLQRGRDHVLEELGFDLIEGRMRVSFLDERVYCAPAPLIQKLEQLAAVYSSPRK